MSKFQDPALRWAHRHDPYTAVKVWWHGQSTTPVLSVTRTGEPYVHKGDGRYHGGATQYDLVPLQEPLLECWVNVHGQSTFGATYESEEEAWASADKHAARAVKMREVRDE